MNDGTADLAGERCARTPVPAANCELPRPDPLGGPRLAPDTVRRHEPAYPLGPRFAGPRQGLTMGSAPSTPDRSALRRKSTGCRTAPASTRQLGIRRRLRPTPCPPTRRHGASGSRREWRRGDGRPATSAPGTGSGAASRGAGRWGFKGVAESPCQTVRVKHGVGWLTLIKCARQPPARPAQRDAHLERPEPHAARPGVGSDLIGDGPARMMRDRCVEPEARRHVHGHSGAQARRRMPSCRTAPRVRAP